VLTLDQVDTFHAERGNDAWAALADKRAAALLNALDYVEQTYAPLIDDAEDHPRYKIAVSILALRLTENPQSGVSAPVVKKEAKEGAGFKKETEFFEPVSTDPFPGVTRLFQGLTKTTTAPALVIGKLVRR
jgi:hypothetical protein